MTREEFSSFDSVIDYLKTAPEGTYVDNYDVGNGTLARVSAKEALEYYEACRDIASADELATFKDVLDVWNINDVKKQVEEGGEAALFGYWLYTADAITTEQEGWDDEDEAKDIDFSEYPYWMTTEDDAGPIGYDDLDEAIKDIIQDDEDEEE